MDFIGETQGDRCLQLLATCHSLVRSSDNDPEQMSRKKTLRADAATACSSHCDRQSNNEFEGEEFNSSSPTPRAPSLSRQAVFQAWTTEGDAQERSSWQIDYSEPTAQREDHEQSAKHSRPGSVPMIVGSRREDIRGTHCCDVGWLMSVSLAVGEGVGGEEQRQLLFFSSSVEMAVWTTWVG